MKKTRKTCVLLGFNGIYWDSMGFNLPLLMGLLEIWPQKM
jgi:hypothetical protein